MNVPGTRVTSPAGSKAEPAWFHTMLRQPLPAWMFREDLDLPCRKPYVNPNWWHAPQEWPDAITTTVDADMAAALCQACPVQLACADHGLRHERHGTWGGYRLESMKAATRRMLLAEVARDMARERRQRPA